MSRPDRGRGVAVPRCVVARGVPDERGAPRLVERGPIPHPVAERGVHDAGVLGEAGRRVAGRPAARVLQLLRQVPVVKGDPGLDPLLQQLVDESPVEVEARRVGRSRARGLNPGPRDREPVRAQPQAGHQRDIVTVAVIVVGGDVSGVPAGDLARRLAECVPYGRCAPVGRGRAFDLVRRGGRPPDEAVREPEEAVLLGRGRHGQVEAGLGDVEGLRGSHALTAPSMMPPMIWRPKTRNTITSGRVATAVAANTNE